MVLPSAGANGALSLVVVSRSRIEGEAVLLPKKWVIGLARIVCIKPAKSEVSGKRCNEM